MMQVVLSGENRYDNYGNFFFKDKEDKERKIGTKRENFQELCELIENNPDRAITLKYDEYKKIKYIVGVELLEIPVDETKITEQQIAAAATAPKSTPSLKPDPKNRSYALSYAKDIACARIQAGKESTPKDVLSMAELFTNYLDNGLPVEALKVYAEIQKEFKKED